jgi:predicted metal-dependent hydrolase
MMFDGTFRILPSRRRRRIMFRIAGDGILELLTPPGIGEETCRKLVENNQTLIAEMYRRFAARPLPVCYDFVEGEAFPLWDNRPVLKFSSRLALMTEEEVLIPRKSRADMLKTMEQLYRQKAVELLPERCRFFGEARRLIPRSIGVTGAVTRWGSCNSCKHISFCWKIMLLPGVLADYIICHELAHLQFLNHSPDFWRLTEELCPNALDKRKRLRALPPLWPAE